MKQMPNDSPLTFADGIQYQAKMHSAVNKQNLWSKEKQAQIALIDSMAGLEPKIGHILHGSDFDHVITAIWGNRRTATHPTR